MLLIFLSTLLAGASAFSVCEPSNRTDCGFSGINQLQCETKGCCWQPATDSARGFEIDTPWCFFKSGPPTPSPPSPPPSPRPPPSGPCDTNNRTDCKIGDKPSCQNAGCCWSPDGNGGPAWCFYHSQPSAGCATTPQCSGHGSCLAASPGVCNCTAGYTTCGPPSANDCSVDLGTDINNCGGCGKQCDQGKGVASSSCRKGTCAVTCDANYKLCFGDCVQTTNCALVGPYTDQELAQIHGFFTANMLVTGGVLASPSKTNPDYYYHWMRDAAISMNVLRAYGVSKNHSVGSQFKAYIGWAHKVQMVPDENCDVRGEPKFEMDGTAYKGGWMRPQNDGPALRTIAMVNFAIDQWDAGDKTTAHQLIGSDEKSPGIVRDLAYVMEQWNQASGDPWEEVKGDIFFTHITQRKSLIWGSKLATLLNNPIGATWAATAKSMEPAIDAHWSQSKGIYMEMAGRRELDSAVHLGILYGDTEDGFLPVNGERAQSSVAKLVDAFSHGYYHINDVDDAAGVPGILVGRYPNDTYQGGCPWILTTQALGEVYYRNAELITQQGANVTTLSRRFFEQTLEHALRTNHHPNGLAATLVLQKYITVAEGGLQVINDASDRLLMSQLLIGQGDGCLLRVKHHISGLGLHMAEQINRDTGGSVSAVDLTWSYGTALAAVTARAKAAAAMHAAFGV